MSGTTVNINTEVVHTTANTLVNLNNGMDTDFEKVITAISALDSNWNGSAATAAISKFNSIKSSYYVNPSTSRKAVMNSYINFLRGNVAMNYECTEKMNISLADQFK